MTKKDVVEYYKAKLSTNEKWAVRGLERIAMRQTAYELEEKSTKENNGVGFSGPDAEILTSFYRVVRAGYMLTARQMEVLLQKMPKYANQLVTISLNEGKLVKEGRVYRFSR